jgi:solute carrier family 9 (sodium/hydrogen exchanger), member 6/7
MSNFALSIDSFIVFALLLLYVVGGGYMEHKKSPFGHETGIALIAGLIISGSLRYLAHNNHYNITFDGDIFFYVCLPPIIFASGFNMRRKRFFNNIGYVLLFGIFGTITTFFAFMGLTKAFVGIGTLEMYYQG